MVHSVRFELTPHRLRAEYATVNAICGWIVKNCLLRAIQDHTGSKMTLTFSTFHVVLLVNIFKNSFYNGSPSTDRTYDIFVNSEAQLPLCYRGIDWLQRQDSHLRSPAYETGEDDWTPLLCDNWRRRWDSNPPGMDRQSTALPEDYYGILVLRTGFDPASPT